MIALGGVVWIGVRVGSIPLELFVVDGWPGHLAAGLAGGGALVGIWEMMRRHFRQARTLEDRIADLLGPLQTSEAVALAAISGFAEELFFRGAMQGAWGWPIATAVFALLHTGPGSAFRVWTGFAAVAGLLLAGLMEWSGSLLAPVVAHALVNGVNLVRLGHRGPTTAGPTDAT